MACEQSRQSFLGQLASAVASLPERSQPRLQMGGGAVVPDAGQLEQLFQANCNRVKMSELAPEEVAALRQKTVNLMRLFDEAGLARPTHARRPDGADGRLPRQRTWPGYAALWDYLDQSPLVRATLSAQKALGSDKTVKRSSDKAEAGQQAMTDAATTGGGREEEDSAASVRSTALPLYRSTASEEARWKSSSFSWFDEEGEDEEAWLYGEGSLFEGDTVDPAAHSTEMRVYGPDGFDQFNYNRRGYSRGGFNVLGRDEEGFDPAGYDRDGYNRHGLDVTGHMRDGRDAAGFDAKGLDRAGRDLRGYAPDATRVLRDTDGYNEDGYDADGYDRLGYDRIGQNRAGEWHPFFASSDKAGFYEDGLDATGRNFAGEMVGLPLPDRASLVGGPLPERGEDRWQMIRAHYDERACREGVRLRCPACGQFIGAESDGHACPAWGHVTIIHYASGAVVLPSTARGTERQALESLGYYPNAREGVLLTPEGHTILSVPGAPHYAPGWPSGYRYDDEYGTIVDRAGYDRQGYNIHGRNRQGFDPEGYDADGYDADGLDRAGHPRPEMGTGPGRSALLTLDDVRADHLRPGENLYQNEYLRRLYSSFASAVAGRSIRVKFSEAESRDAWTDMNQTIAVDPVPLGKQADPVRNALVVQADLAHEVGHLLYSEKAFMDLVFAIGRSGQFPEMPPLPPGVSEIENYNAALAAVEKGQTSSDTFPIFRSIRVNGVPRVFVPPPAGIDKARGDLPGMNNCTEDGRMEREVARGFAGAAEMLAAGCYLMPRWTPEAMVAQVEEMQAQLAARGITLSAEEEARLQARLDRAQLQGALLYEVLPYFRVEEEHLAELSARARTLYEELIPVVRRCVDGTALDAYQSAVTILRRMEAAGLYDYEEPEAPAKRDWGSDDEPPKSVTIILVDGDEDEAGGGGGAGSSGGGGGMMPEVQDGDTLIASSSSGSGGSAMPSNVRVTEVIDQRKNKDTPTSQQQAVASDAGQSQAGQGEGGAESMGSDGIGSASGKSEDAATGEGTSGSGRGEAADDEAASSGSGAGAGEGAAEEGEPTGNGRAPGTETEEEAGRSGRALGTGATEEEASPRPAAAEIGREASAHHIGASQPEESGGGGGGAGGSESSSASPPGQAAAGRDGSGEGSGGGGGREVFRPLSDEEFASIASGMEAQVASGVRAQVEIDKLPTMKNPKLTRPLGEFNDFMPQQYRGANGQTVSVEVDARLVSNYDPAVLAKLDAACKVQATKLLAKGAFKELAQPRPTERRGARAGVLRNEGLVGAERGEKGVFRKRGQDEEADSFAVSVQMDVSGSMGGHVKNGNIYRVVGTLEATFDLLRRRGKNVASEHRAFNAKNYQLKSVGDRAFRPERRARMLTLTEHGSTEEVADSVGLGVAALSSLPHEHKVVVVITDGAFRGDQVAGAASTLGSAREGLRNDPTSKFHTFGIFLGANPPADDFDLMFGEGNWAAVPDLGEVAEVVGSQMLESIRRRVRGTEKAAQKGGGRKKK